MLEGDKAIGYELFEQLGASPDWIVVPVGAGPPGSHGELARREGLRAEPGTATKDSLEEE